ILVKFLAIAPSQRNAHVHRDQRTGETPGLRIVGERRDLRRGDNAVQGRISSIRRMGDVIVGAAGEFVHHGGGQNLLKTIAGGTVLKSRNGDAANVAGQRSTLSADVVAAAKKQRKK